jgi:hypothetical protein
LIYANRAALGLWRRNWSTMVGMPSSQTAEPQQRASRQQALATAQQQHAISDYSGIRHRPRRPPLCDQRRPHLDAAHRRRQAVRPGGGLWQLAPALTEAPGGPAYSQGRSLEPPMGAASTATASYHCHCPQHRQQPRPPPDVCSASPSDPTPPRSARSTGIAAASTSSSACATAPPTTAFWCGAKRTALIDSSHLKFESTWLPLLQGQIDPRAIDHLIVSHTEPDHSGLIGHLIDLNPDLEIVASKVAIQFLENQVHRPFNSRAVKSGDELDLGTNPSSGVAHRFEFLSAPNLHWPEHDLLV